VGDKFYHCAEIKTRRAGGMHVATGEAVTAGARKNLLRLQATSLVVDFCHSKRPQIWVLTYGRMPSKFNTDNCQDKGQIRIGAVLGLVCMKSNPKKAVWL
jgi:hypothetical protein